MNSLARSPRSMFRCLLAFVLAMLALFLVPAAGHAAGPQLGVSVSHDPVQFIRGDLGDGLAVTVKNDGDEATTGLIQLTVSLPPSLQVRSINSGSLNCPTAEAIRLGAAFTCSYSGSLGAEATLVQEFSVFVDTDAPQAVEVDAEVSGGSSAPASGSTVVEVIDRSPFGVATFGARSIKESGADEKLSGGHPFAATTHFSIPTFSGLLPVEDVRDVFTDLPPGFLGAVSAVGSCPLATLSSGFIFSLCPADSKVGTITLRNTESESTYSLYNLVPEHGFPAEFGFTFANQSVVFYAKLRPRSEGYGVEVIAQGVPRYTYSNFDVELYGVPALRNGSGGPPIPFLSNPVDCSNADPTTRLAIDSWQHPAKKRNDGLLDLSDPLWKTATVVNPRVEGCSDPALVAQWNPDVTTIPVQEGPGPVQANQPAGLNVHLHFDQSNDPTDPANIAEPANYDPKIPQAPELKTATVALPAGMAISPSGANGLGACSDQASLPQGDQVHYDTVNPVTCPNSSKVGTVTATSPLLAARNGDDEVTGPEPVSGDVYILTPHPGDLPAGGEGDGKYRLLIQIDNERYGLNVKLPGVAVANKDTGQLTATFTENPQLPVKDLHVEFFSGPRAALSTPKTCGTFTTTTDLEAWSAPGTPNAHPSSAFDVKAGPNGTPCVSSLGERNFAPKLSAGTTDSKAGASAPFVMNISRGDSEQELSSLEVNLPPGLTAKLAGIPYCSEAAIAAASGRSGKEEQASPSCPAASQVGSVTVGAGPGPSPYHAEGKAYLAGPYKGAPLSFAFITPAVAGPFDLGNVVVRAAAFVDPETAKVAVKTDPLPQILDGVPLGIRTIQAKIDRPGFTLNPTDCEAMALSAGFAGSNGGSSNASEHFQVGQCGKLGFKPRLSLRFKGKTKRTGNPAITAVLRAPAHQANIANTTVILPKSEFIDNAHINNPCTRVQFNADECPAGSVLGKATAYTPLLDKPLSGPVYFRSNGGDRELPDLVADLGGQIHVTLVGFIDTAKNGGVRTRFANVPDAPVSKFVLELKGGKKGLIENSRNLCSFTPRATVQMTAQNGKLADSRPKIGIDCGKKGKKKRGRS